MTAPREYLGALIPADIRAGWRTWEAVEWRRMQHYNRGELYAPDQRFTVSPPAGMCRLHREHWVDWRDRWFKGRSFPGGCAGDGFLGMRYVYRPTAETAVEEWVRYRAEWDELTCGQMRQVEELCLSLRSSQCAGERRSRAIGLGDAA